MIANLSKIVETKTEIKSILEEVFGGEEFVDARPNDEYYIYIPEEMVISEKGFTHRIKDLYIKLKFLTEDNIFVLYEISGGRATLSFPEYCYGYYYSHLNTYGHYFGNFCFGVTKLNDIYRELRNEYNSELFLLFCYQLKDYLKWESIKGTPYRYIESIKIPNEYYINNQKDFVKVFSIIYNKFHTSGYIPKFRINEEKQREIIVDNLFINTLNQLCPDEYKQLYNIRSKTYIETLNIDKINKEIRTINESKNILLSFKNNPVYFKIDDFIDIRDKSSEILYIPQEVVIYMVEVLNKRFNLFLERKFLKKHEHYITRVY